MEVVDVSTSARSFVGPVDPFATFPLLYFLPESVKTLELPASASDPEDIEAIHEFLKSKITVSNISKQLPLHAKKIVNSAKKSIKDATARQPLKEIDMNSLRVTKGIKHTMAEGMKNDYDAQKRRPGFGRKKARFSLKPMSQDIVVTSAQPNFDQLKDPDEFFAAYERQENAEKELRRLMGENLVDQSSSHCLLESRMRRQGILGKTATYRHSYTAISVDASKHLSTVEKSETGNNSIPSPRNDYGLPSSASMSVHGTGMNQGMAKDNVLNENGKGTEIGAPLDRHHDELFGSLLDSYCNLDEGQTFNLLQKSLKLQEIDMHKIQFPKFNRFSLHEIMSPQASTSREESRLESKIFNFADQTLNSKVSEETPKTDHAVWGTTHSPATSPTPPKSPFAAISSFCRHKSQKMSEKDTSHSSLMFNLMKESSFATHFELEAPSHPGDILQQGRLAILHGPASESVDKNGSLLDGFPHSKELEKNTTRTGLNSVTTQADGLAGPEWHGQEKNLTVDSSYEIESSSISQLPGQEACDIDKNSSAFETVSVDCLSDQVSDKNSNMENSIMKISNSCCPIQRLTSEECKTVSSDFGRNGARDDVTCPGVELGKNSNGSDNDVNPPTGMSNDCMNDKNLDMENSIMKISNSCCPIQRLTSEECKTVSSDFGRNVARDDVTCPGVELGKNSNGSDSDVNPPTGMSNDCMNDKNLDMENSIMKISNSCCPIQRLTSAECKTVSSDFGRNVARDDVTCPGVEQGKNSNGSDNDVNPPTGMSNDCMNDKNLDIDNSIKIQSTPGIQHLALKECDAVNMLNNGLTCSAGEDLGKNPKGSANCVDPQTGALGVCIENSVQATANPSSTAQEVVDSNKGQGSPTGVCKPQEQHVNETSVSSDPQNETSEAASKALGRKRSKRLDSDRRKSLLGAGSAWQCGVRRSTRIKSRPLEYWKGERFLYGRVHNSLVTVIGVKYSSPVDNSKNRTLKVKSFVSDEYSHMLDLAGSH